MIRSGVLILRVATRGFFQRKDLFIAHSATRHGWPLPESDLDSLEPVKMEKDHVFLSFDPECVTLAPDPLPDDCYVKHQRLSSLDFDDARHLRRLSYSTECRQTSDVCTRTQLTTLTCYPACQVITHTGDQ